MAVGSQNGIMDYFKHFELSQETPYFYIKGVRYKRLTWGEEPDLPSNLSNKPCNDCGALKGQFHSLLCDMENCPRCGFQARGCNCNRTTSWLFSPLYWFRWLLKTIGFNVNLSTT